MIKTPVLGIIGGGQLGSLLCKAARKLNIKTCVLSDDSDAPAKKFADDFIYGKYQNVNKINQFIKKIDVATFEFENIPVSILKKINKKIKVFPKPQINAIVQNRFLEKKFVNHLKIPTTNYKLIKNRKDIKDISTLLPGILKTTTLGYDGKGQYVIKKLKDFEKNKINFNKEYILEKKIDLKKEISVIVTVFQNKKYSVYEPIENVHKNQILHTSTIPAKISYAVKNKAKNYAVKIAKKLNYIGTMCVEYFIDKNNKLLVNEIAPRVHNSGHLTIEAFNISQFENHVRAVCNLSRKPLKKIRNAKMINIIGSDLLRFKKKKFKKNEYFYDYLKNQIKTNRKMGHLTTLV